MANSYDKNEIIKSKDKNFENLRKNLDDFIKKSTRQNPIGTQGLQNIPNKANVASSVTETQFAKVNSNPMTNAINLIYNIVHNGYMKHEGHTTQNTKINNTGSKSKNDIIPALPEYYEIVNYWDGGTSDGTLSSNSSRCNGACTGFCAGTCYGNGDKNFSCSGCDTDCNSYCEATCRGECGKGCKHGCRDDCYMACSSVCSGECYTACDNSGNIPQGDVCLGCSTICGADTCRSVCKNSCAANCTNGCKGCGSQCIGFCSKNCKQSCNDECGGGCKGHCKNGCGSSCQGNCIISATS